MKRLASTARATAALLALASLGLASAPGAFAQETAADYPIEPTRERVRLVNIDGYSVIDREHLVLSGANSRHYLVTLNRPCPDLNFGARIATSFPRIATLRPPYTDKIYAGRGPGCSIDAVEEIVSVDVARALVERRIEAEEAAAEAADASSER